MAISGFEGFPSRLCLKAVFKTCMTCTNAECTVVELLMMGRGTARNIQSAKPKIKFENSASGWFLLKEICYDARSHERKKMYQPTSPCFYDMALNHSVTGARGFETVWWSDFQRSKSPSR